MVSALKALGLVVERLEAAWLPASPSPDPQFHPYQALRVDQFLAPLAVAMEIAPGDRFLEVGSGIGTKLLLAAGMGLQAHGIENRETYLAVAARIARMRDEKEPLPVELEGSFISFELGDATRYDWYRDWDIVYANRIVVSEEGQVAFDARLTKQMRKGAVLIVPWREWDSSAWTATSHPWVWVR